MKRFTLLALALFAWGCGDNGKDPEPDIVEIEETESETELVEQGPTVRFDLEAARSDEFFAFPYPSELRTTNSGAPDLSGFPQAGQSDTLDGLIAALAEGDPGFSPNGAIYFAIEAPLAPQGLPQEPEDSLDETAAVFMVNLSPNSPAYKQKALCTVHFLSAGSTYNPANLLVLQPYLGLSLRPGERYAAVVTDRVILASGELLSHHPDWELMESSVLPPPGVPAELHAQVGQLTGELADAGIDVASVVVATAFETSEPMRGIDAIRSAVEALPFAIPSALEHTTSRGLNIYEGTFPLTDYLQGSAPYASLGQGVIVFGSDGKPAVGRDYDTRFAIVTPPTDPESPIHPLMVYVPGNSGDYRDYVDHEASVLGAAGFAAVSMDAPLASGRNPTAQTTEELYAAAALDNLPAYRDLLRQRVADILQLMRFIEILSIDGTVSPTGDNISLPANPLIMMGHQTGATVAALAMGVEPRIRSAILSAPAASLARMLVARSHADYAQRFGLAPAERLDDTHPVVNLVLQPILDPADPVNAAARLYREEPGLPKDVVVVLGAIDTLTPPLFTTQYAAAAGIPPVDGPLVPSELFDIAGLDAVPSPVVANKTFLRTDCPRTPCSFTAGLLSYDSGDDTLWVNEDLQARYLNFAITAWQGIPIIDVPTPP